MSAYFSRKTILRMLRKGQVETATQTAALCWRIRKEKLQILLITSRDTGRWVVPKGWPMTGKSLAESAAQEAWEEGGVTGKVRDMPIGVFGYRKQIIRESVPCVAAVFPLRVKSLAAEFPEKGQRRRKWVSRKKAAKLVREPELAELIRRFKPNKRR